ncbi:unnamed protein product [Pocillopora meandrina]|uniref:C-type lectin domain-containing protein n=1 Tax=Pocillopora meandrina TaxID=46732 RepID=A0AAU9WUV1_9CNID|nr:unnamed protein product [Pocillopora meandrina]
MRTALCTFLLFAFGVANATEDPVTDEDSSNCIRLYKGSSYTFHRNNSENWYSWSNSRDLCKNAGYDLVSIESYGEWNYLNQTIQTFKTGEYFIGLKKDISSEEWRWLSDNSTVNASRKGVWPWARSQPNNPNSDHCAQMYKTHGGSGRYNDVRCDLKLKQAGYICERCTECTVREGWINIFFLVQGLRLRIPLVNRHRKTSPSDHAHDRVTCTYEVPLSSELQSIDPVLIQQMQSSAELTVHLTLSQTESVPATYETVSDCKKECERDNIDETNRKSRSVREGYSDTQERVRENTVLVSGEKGIQQPHTLCDNKEENKDHVYAVVHKERKGRANSKASTLRTPSDRPQEGTRGSPVNRGSFVDCVDRSSHPTDSGLGNNAKAAESKTPQVGGNIEYLYAAVDKTKRKKKPPQKPSPYRGLVYADMVHSRESSAKLIKEQSQTVYAQINHAKTACVMISQQNLEEKEKGEHQPSSSEQTSLDPVQVQQAQSSAELTVHLTFSRTESGLTTYETVSDCKKERGYDNVETNRKSSSVSEGRSGIQERARENTVLVSGDKGIQQPSTLCDEEEENKDHFVHKERKGRASFEVSAREKTPGRPYEETSDLLVKRAS